MRETAILAEFERLKWCPEREQLRIINELEERGSIEVNWNETKDKADIKIGPAFEVRNFKINKKAPLQNAD